MPAVAHELLRVSLGPRHDRAGGVDDLKSARFKFANDPLTHSVGGDCDSTILDPFGGHPADLVLDFIRPRELMHADALKATDHMRVMDDFANAIDRLLRPGFGLHNLHRSANTHAEAHVARADHLDH